MTLKELSQLYYLRKEIEMDKQRLEALRAKAQSPASASSDGTPRTQNTVSRVERYTAAIVELEAVIAAKREQCIYERARLEKYIAEIPDSYIRQIFTYRFVNGLSWITVSIRLGGKNTADGVKKACYRYLSAEKKQLPHSSK